MNMYLEYIAERYNLPIYRAVPTVEVNVATPKTLTRQEHKDWYLEMLGAELEALPEGPHKTEALTALRGMVARMVMVEDALTAAKAAKERALVSETEAKAKAQADAKSETEKAAIAAKSESPALLSSQLAPMQP